MQVVTPHSGYSDEDDPIMEAVALKETGDHGGARRLLMQLLHEDLRCLDAHAHLGNLVFDSWPERAIRHFAAGVAIGDLALPSHFDGLLPWGRLRNRPYLRCLHGHGLCLWRLGHADEAAQVFTRMLSLNPHDNQGARFLLRSVEDGQGWEDLEGE